MNEERGQFTFYRSFYKAIKRIKDDAMRALAYDTVCAYALTGIEPDIDDMPDIVALCFELIKPNLESARRKSKGGKSKDTDKIPASNDEDTAKMPERCEEDTDKISASRRKDSGNKKEKEVEIEKENKKEKEKEVEIEDECHISRAKPKEIEFERFWASYPRKVGKTDAKRSFLRIKGVSIDTLIDAVEQQKQSLQWQKENGAYIPNPATWLNQGRWEDKLPSDDLKGTVPNESVISEKEIERIRKVYERIKSGG